MHRVVTLFFPVREPDSPLKKQLAGLELLIPAGLVLHGILVLIHLGAAMWHVALLAGIGGLGLLSVYKPSVSEGMHFVRANALIGLMWVLMLLTGGVNSLFVPWYFAVVAVYPLLFAQATFAWAIPGVVTAAFLLLLPFSPESLPLLAVAIRASLLLLVGGMACAIGRTLWSRYPTSEHAEMPQGAQATSTQPREWPQLALEAAQVGTWDWNLTTNQAACSNQGESILGLPKSGFGGTYEAFLGLVHPDDRDAVEQRIAATLHGALDWYETEHRIVWPDGTIRWVENRGQVIQTTDGRPTRMAGTVVDTTERKQAKEALRQSKVRLQHHNRVLAKLAQRMRDTWGNLDQSLHIITEAVAEALCVERTNVWLLDEQHAQFTCIDHYQRSTDQHAQGMILKAEEYPSYFTALTDARIVAAHDAHQDERTCEFVGDYFALYDIQSLLDAPVRIGGKLAGVICLEQVGTARTWTPEEQAFAGSAADFVAMALEAAQRKEAEKALRHERELLQTLFDTIPVMITLHDPALDDFRVNKELERVLGWSTEEGQTVDLMKACYPNPAYREEVAAFMQASDPGWRDLEVTSKSGEVVESSWTNLQLTDDTQVGIGIDVSERKKRERESQESEAYRHELYLITSDPDLDDEEKIPRLLKLGCERLGVEIGFISHIDETTGRYVIKTVYGSDYIQAGEETELSKMYCRETIKSDDILSIYNALEEGWAAHPSYAMLHVGCYMGGKILVNNTLYGTLCFINRAPREEPFTHDEKAFVDLMTRWVSHMFERQEREQRLRERERQLSTLMSNIPGMVYRCQNEPDWPMEFVSEGCLELTGYEPTSLVRGDVNWGQSVILEDNDDLWRQVQQSLAERKPFRVTYPIRTADGDRRWVKEQGRGVFAADGTLEALEGVIIDITERIVHEQELTRMTDLLQRIQRMAQIGGWEVDVRSDPPKTSWTEELYRLHGLPRDTDINVDVIVNCYHPDDQHRIRDCIETSLANGTGYDIEARMCTGPDGIRWVRAIGDAIYENNELATFRGAIQDVTERMRADEALRESENRLRTLVENTPIIFFAVDRDGIFTVSEGRQLVRQGLEPGKVVGQSVFDLYADFPDIVDHFRRSLQGQELTWKSEVRDRVWDVYTAPLWDENGEIAGVIGVATDVTEPTRVARENARLVEDLRTMSVRLLETQEQERRRVARELHDEAGALLTSLQMCMDTAIQHVPTEEKASMTVAHDELEEAQKLTSILSAQIRQMALNLRPSVLDDLGLAAALRWLVDQHAKRTGLVIRLYQEIGEQQRFAEAVETAAYRIIQEALTNAFRYAGVEEVQVMVNVLEDCLRIHIIDEGVGFDLNRVRNEHGTVGLSSMRERAELLQGELEIATAPGEGTRISATLPIQAPKRDPR